MLPMTEFRPQVKLLAKLITPPGLFAKRFPISMLSEQEEKLLISFQTSTGYFISVIQFWTLCTNNLKFAALKMVANFKSHGVMKVFKIMSCSGGGSSLMLGAQDIKYGLKTG